MILSVFILLIEKNSSLFKIEIQNNEQVLHVINNVYNPKIDKKSAVYPVNRLASNSKLKYSGFEAAV